MGVVVTVRSIWNAGIWLARGTAPICLTCHIDDMRDLVKEGYALDQEWVRTAVQAMQGKVKSYRPNDAERIANDAAAIATIPAASESIPSIRLYALVATTTPPPRPWRTASSSAVPG